MTPTESRRPDDREDHTVSAQLDHRAGDESDVAEGVHAVRPHPQAGRPSDTDTDTDTDADAERDDVPRAAGEVRSPGELRADFGAHVESDYPRLVALLYAITLDPGEAHDVVQDAYSRAWRDWAAISRMPDPTAWIRRVAVRSTIRSWRRVLGRVGGAARRPTDGGVDARTGALLGALARLPAAERRTVVLFHMAGLSLTEIAALEQASRGTVQARLARARNVVTEGLADVLPAVLGLMTGSNGLYQDNTYEGDPYVDEGEYR